MNLYLVRHGQSVPNLKRQHSGWSQDPLTEKGFEDARRAGEFLRDIPFDRVYSSDLRRAVQTARTALPDLEPIQLDLLRERSVGTLSGRCVSDCFANLGETYLYARENIDFTPYGGENLAMLTDRAAKFFALLESDPAENVIAFTHAGFIEASVEYILGVHLDRRRIQVPNAAILRFAYNAPTWQLVLGGAR